MISLNKLFTEASDLDLCRAVFTRIVEHYGNEINASAVGNEERIVLLVWHAMGIIGNGGFNYLFESDFRGDRHFVWTAAAFQTIGCSTAARRFRKL